jgi:hypothetical protein
VIEFDEIPNERVEEAIGAGILRNITLIPISLINNLVSETCFGSNSFVISSDTVSGASVAREGFITDHGDTG